MFIIPNINIMKTINYSGNIFGGKVLCSLFGHKFRTTKHITNHFREFECSVCRLQKTNDTAGHLISLTDEHKEINKTLIYIYKKRHPEANFVA